MHAPPTPASKLGAPAVLPAAILILAVSLCAAVSAVSAQGVNGSWSQLPPPILDEVSAAYDRARNRLLLFGGRMGEAVTNHLWALSLDGSNAWSLIPTAGPRPAARQTGNLIYDPVNDRLWLFGGGDASDVALGDLWTLPLGGVPLTWIQASPAGPAPVARVYSSAVLDTLNNRVILFGGAETMNPDGPPADMLADVWAMPLTDPLTWVEITPAGTPPSQRAGSQIIWDGATQQLVVFGGYDGAMLNDTYVLSLSGSPAWSVLSAAGGPPAERAVGVAIWNPPGARMLVFGGVGGNGDEMLSDLWELSLGGSPAWTELTPAGSWPSARQIASGAYDGPGNAMVIYGGRDTSGHAVADLAWSLSLGGSPQWNQIGGSTIPDREQAAGILDPIRHQVVVYGGRTYPDQFFDDTWSYDLAAMFSWSALSPAGGDPGLRWGHSAIYDPVRDRMVIFGGSDANDVSQNDAWALSLSGTPTWTQLSTSGGPPGARTEHAAIYDRSRDRMVIFGGYGPSMTSDTWALDMSTNVWSQVDPGFSGPGFRSGAAAVFDAANDRMVVYGGASDSSVWALPFGGSPTWTELAFVGTPPRARYRMGAAYDSSSNSMLLFGGQVATYDTMLNASTALLLRGTPTWMPLDFGPDLPTERQGSVAGYDQSSTTLYVTGGCCQGANDVWAASFDWTTPVQGSLVSASAVPGWARVTWWVPSGIVGVTIQRNAGSGWTTIAVRDPDGTGMLAFEDHDVLAGHRYGYRLLLPTGGGVTPVSEVWLDVPPGASLALTGFQPNPATAGARVAFRLASAAPARLQVLDVAGRSMLSREVGALGPGNHIVPLYGASPGTYLIRLTQGGQTLTRKATLLP